MMQTLETALRSAGVHELRRTGAELLLGRLEVPGAGVARALARLDASGFTAQLHWHPLKLDETALRAVERFLAIMREQVRGGDLSAGLSAKAPVIWLGVSGRMEEAPHKSALLTGLARLAIRPLQAICSDDDLAALYVAMQERGSGAPGAAANHQDGR